MGTSANPLAPGVYVIGKAVGNFEFISREGKSGKPFQLVTGQVLAGTQFVKVSQFLQSGEQPILLQDGDDVLCKCVGDQKTGVLMANVKLERPEIASK